MCVNFKSDYCLSTDGIEFTIAWILNEVLNHWRNVLTSESKISTNIYLLSEKSLTSITKKRKLDHYKEDLIAGYQIAFHVLSRNLFLVGSSCPFRVLQLCPFTIIHLG